VRRSSRATHAQELPDKNLRLAAGTAFYTEICRAGHRRRGVQAGDKLPGRPSGAPGPRNDDCQRGRFDRDFDRGRANDAPVGLDESTGTGRNPDLPCLGAEDVALGALAMLSLATGLPPFEPTSQGPRLT